MVSGMVGLAISMFAITWAWLGFTWFSSAYDTDDWGMRVATLVQMVGVLVLALGVPALFHGLETWHVDNLVLVMGYVVMRVSMITLWLRAAHADAGRRPVLRRYAYALLSIQAGWVVLALLPLPAAWMLPLMGAMGVAEVLRG